MHLKNLVSWLGIAGLSTAAGCLAAGNSVDGPEIGATSQAVSPGNVIAGKRFFETPFSGSNDRSCATCHTAQDDTALSPATVQARLAANPADPLFNAIDADDPNAEVLTFNNLKAGLVRVTLKLPDNVDLIAIPPVASIFTPRAISAQILAGWQASIIPGSHLGDPMPPPVTVPTPNGPVTITFQPEILTNADRTIDVWREVPSVKNTAYTGPYLFDGRATKLEDQAIGAINSHSQASHNIGNGLLTLIAEYERSLFTSNRAEFVNNQLLAGVALVDIPDPEAAATGLINLTSQQASGKVIYDQACAGCHGAATDNKIVDRSIHDGLFFALDANGNTIWDPIPVGPSQVVFVPRSTPRPDEEAINIGASFLSHIGQVGGAGFPLFNNSNGVVLPRYRLRFYTDSTRTTKIMDLPPLPVTSSATPFVPFTPAADPAKPGALIVGSNFGPELFTTDPGRALICKKATPSSACLADWADFEGFDVPQLRGVAKTAPYFHDHSQANLAVLINTYSQFILPFLPQLDQFFPPAAPGADRLTAQQKADLEEFLRVF